MKILNDKYAILWDVDGTLLDSSAHHFKAWQWVVGEHGQEFTEHDFALTFGRRNPEVIAQIFNNRFNEAESLELANQKEAYYRDIARAGISLLPGVIELLNKFKAAHFAQAICSSAPRENLDFLLELIHIRPFFGAVVGSEDTQQGKPDPEVFLLGAARLGLDPANCLVIEDAPAGIQGAKAAGMKALGVTFIGHHSPAQLLAVGADKVVPSLEHVTLTDVQTLLGIN